MREPSSRSRTVLRLRAMRFGLDPEGQRLMYATVLDRNSAIADEPTMGTPGSRMKRSSSRQRITGCCCIESWMARDGILSTRRGTFRPRCRPFVSLPANSVIDRGTDRARYMDEPPRLTHTSTMNTSFAMVLVALTVACSASPSPKPEPDVAPGPDAQIVVAARRDSTVRVVLTAIQGREALPAESVFVNIRNFRGMPAGRLLQIMTGFSASLGVGCDHCHVPGDWASETKPTKQIARDMGVMVSRLQRELLRPIPGLAGRTPTVTCVTCHNGRVKPMTRLAAPARP